MNSVKRKAIILIFLSAVLLVVLYNFRWFYFYLEHLNQDEVMGHPKWGIGRMHKGLFNLFTEFIIFLVVSFFNFTWVHRLTKEIRSFRWRIIIIIGGNLLMFFSFLLIGKELHQLFFPFSRHGFPGTFYFVLILSVFILAITLANLLILYRKNKISEIENIRLKEEKTRAELTALKEQISPHFFFNTLSTLSSIVRNEPKEEGLGFIQDMSNTYRYAISSGKKDLVYLEEELEFLHSYIYLTKKRFGDKLTIKIDVPEQFLEKELPPMSLQVLVENAIQHNVVTQAKPLLISIFVENNFLVVSNNLQEKNTNEGFGLGLQNLSNRFQLLMENDIQIEKSDDNFTVKLPL